MHNKMHKYAPKDQYSISYKLNNKRKKKKHSRESPHLSVIH